MKDKKVLLIANYLKSNPKATGVQVSKKFKCALSYAYVLMSKAKGMMWVDEEVKEVMKEISNPTITGDLINHPSHYTTGGIETIDFIEAKQLNYHLGNVIKYITRANHKGDRLENLKKAQWYLNREIDNISK